MVQSDREYFFSDKFRFLIGWSLCACVFLFLMGSCQKNEPAEFSNRLVAASSPYLREHADNPVDWYEWGSEALDKARLEDKPIIISIGYASCHWCHVMEEESFMDTAVARVMNENFVSIKIDREERPDIDQVYMTAAQLISGNAGWPLNAFALPNGKPFYAGTYFTKDQWLNLLQQILTAYREDNRSLIKQADAITKGILENEVIEPAATGTSNDHGEIYKRIFSSIESKLDDTSGGLKGAPKFPMPVVWEFLLQDYYYTNNTKALEATTITLNAMANGGIYDHLGGGFARYGTDANWKIPHFEKMLYDNGQLVSLYSHAYQVTADPVYSKVISETLDFIHEELTSPDGGFYSSLNADSEGEEGTFYVWTKAEIETVLDRQSATIFNEYYSVTEEGNWENQKNVLYRESTTDDIAKNNNVSVAEVVQSLAAAKAKLLERRNKRIQPSLDDKILTSWNALMLIGYLDAYCALDKQQYLEAAKSNAQFLKKHMLQENGKLWRSYSNNNASIDAFLDDYALLANAYIKLYQATFEIEWLSLARTIADYAILHFQDSQTGFFYYTPEASQLIVRKMELSDQVIPSSNSLMADVLFKLGQYYSEESYLAISNKMLNHISKDMLENGPYYANWASLLGKVSFQPYEVAIMGNESLEKSHALMKNYLPDVLLMGGTEENLPLLEDKFVADKTIIYVCRDKVCKLPVREVKEALQQLHTKK